MTARIQAMTLPDGQFMLVLDEMPRELSDHDREYLVKATGASAVMCFPWPIAVVRDTTSEDGQAQITHDVIDELNARRQQAGQLASAFGVLDQEDLVEILSGTMKTLDKRAEQAESDRNKAVGLLAQTELDRDTALDVLAAVAGVHVERADSSCGCDGGSWPCATAKILGAAHDSSDTGAVAVEPSVSWTPATTSEDSVDVVPPISWSTTRDSA